MHDLFSMLFILKLRPTVYLQNFGRTEVISAFSCYLASATGWTIPKPPAIFATLPGAGCYFVQIQNFKYF